MTHAMTDTLRKERQQATPRHEKATSPAFIFGLHFCAVAAVFRHLRHLANVWLEFQDPGLVVHHSHFEGFEDWDLEQSPSQVFCNHYGHELYPDHPAGRDHGPEVWRKPAGRGLLPRRWNCDSSGHHFNSSHYSMR